jgi:hypothetical protein
VSHIDIDQQYSDLRVSLTEYLLDGGRIAVVKAPPGSGKTHNLIEVLSVLVGAGKRIAVAAQTNSQADDICDRFAKDHHEVAVDRFTSKDYRLPDDFPSSVGHVIAAKDLRDEPGVVVGTTAKWSLTDLPGAPFDLLAVDEAWQMAWADFMQCATISGRFLLIGDPGQIPPVVTIDVRRWETSPRAPHEATPNIVLADPTINDRFEGSLPACRRLPHESVVYVKPFYDFDFAAYVEPGASGVDLPRGHRLDALSDGRPILATLATPAGGPPVEVDHELAAAVASLIEDLIRAPSSVRIDGRLAPLQPSDIGVTSSHRVMNAAIASALGSRSQLVRVDTPERWQGLQKPVMIAVHPMSGVVSPSSFDLDTGRLCVMASRHQAGLIIVSRDHVGETLANYVPSAEQAPGRPDRVGRGHDAHLTFWHRLIADGRVRAVT